MGAANHLQTNFQGGEWSQTYQGRVDLPGYRTALKVCKNALPVEEGAWTRRPGLAHGALLRAGKPGRVIEFAFQQNSPYVMEFTDGHLRFYSDQKLVMTNDAQTVSAVSTANPAVVQTAAAHGWSTGDQVMFNTLGAPDGRLENRQFAITVVDTTHLSIADAITGTNVDGSTLATFTSGNVTRILDIGTPYVAGSWETLRAVQTDGSVTLLHGAYTPYVLTITKSPSITNGVVTYAEFSFAAATFTDGPYLDPVKHGLQLTPSAKTGLISLTLSFPAWSSTKAYTVGDYVTSSAVSYKSLVDNNVNNTPASSPSSWKVVAPYTALSPTGFTVADIGRMIRLASEPSAWASGTTYAKGAVVSYAGSYWTSLNASNTGNIPGLDLTNWQINPTAANWTWGKIVSLQSMISPTLSGSVNIGSMTGGGGLTAAFDSNTSKSASACALSQTTGNFTAAGQTIFLDAWVGKNYSGASAQQILFGTITPSIDFGMVERSSPGGLTIRVDLYTRVRLRASQTTPSGPSDGTVLGEYSSYVAQSTIADVTDIANPVVINSNDQSTAWNYVWFEILVRAESFDNGSASVTLEAYCAQAQFFGTNTSSSNGISVEILGPDLLYTNPITTWRLGVFTGSNWPTCGAYHEGRLFLSGSVANRFDASVSNDLFNFKPTEIDGTVADNDAIDYTLNAPDVNSILWMLPNQQGVVIGTEKGEWLVQASALNSPLTPSSVQAHQVTRIGSSVASTAEPVTTDHTVIFIQRYARKLMEYFADVFSGKFAAPNIAISAGHLTSRGLLEVAYQQSVSPVIWGRAADGSLLGCSYKRETLMSSQGPSFSGWHQHSHGAGNTFQSITIGPSADGATDTLAAVTLRSDGYYQTEFLTTLFQETDALANAQFLDDAVKPTATQNIVMGGLSGMNCTGLWHLNGKTVTVFAGGLDCGDWTVANGAVFVPYSKDPAALFTYAFVQTFNGAMPVVVGFTYTSDGQLVRPALPQDAGSRAGLAIGHKHRTAQVVALLVNTRGISFGTSFDKLNAAQLRSEGETRITATQTFTGTYRDTLTDDYSYDRALCWRVTRPFPATVVAAGGLIQTSDG